MRSQSTSASAFRNLAEIAREGQAGLAAATLDVQAELFLVQAEQGPVDGAQISAFVLMLLPQLGADEAMRLAERLGPCAATPEPVILALCERGGGCAEAVLRRAPRLPLAVMTSALMAGDPRLAAALAERADIGAGQQLLLSDRGEAAVRLALARNAAITLAPEVKRRLLAAARHDPALAEALLTRKELTLDQRLPLYPAATAEQRAEMRRALAEEPSPGGREATITPTEIARLTDVALEGCGALAGALAEALRLDGRFTTAALADGGRELLALGLVSAGVSAPEATRMLLRTGDAIALDSRALTDLVVLMRETSPAVARALIARVIGGGAGRGEHVPFMAPGGTPSRAGATGRRPWPGQILRPLRSQV
jgi:hypothetical protein